MIARTVIDSPVGRLALTEDAGQLTSLQWGGHGGPGTALLDRAAVQIAEYFCGQRHDFDLPLAIGDGFQARFLMALLAIPFGETRSYGDLARNLGVSAQAIGHACGANPLPILVPCHRVLGATGLGGYSGAGGVETKVALLRHEGAAGLLI